MRVCDWIASYLYDKGIKRVHGLMGGGASGLNDGFIKHGKIQYICYHHEQGAGHAAVGESKFTGKISIVNPTTGCGGTNCITSVLNAWQDSIPVIFLSGNVRLAACSRYINNIKNINIRKYGIQEHDIIETVKTITKMSVFVDDVKDVVKVLQEAMHIATTGRPGPVWIDIPGDIQTAQMPDTYEEYVLPTLETYDYDFLPLKQQLELAERPLVLAGYGIRQSGSVDHFRFFIEQYKLPYVSTYGARDYLSYNHYYNIGAVGIKGSRAGNFAMQNADLLLILGSSLGSSVIGYDPAQFSPYSYKIIVDTDQNELDKNIIKIDKLFKMDLKSFFEAML